MWAQSKFRTAYKGPRISLMTEATQSQADEMSQGYSSVNNQLRILRQSDTD